MLQMVMKLGEPEQVFSLVSSLKETGNGFFKRGKFGLAIDQYDLEAKYLLCTWMTSYVDSDVCKDLAVSLHPNLVACALKLGSFQRAFDLCSLVIYMNPNSIKGYFRRARARARARAALELGLTGTTLEDLTTGVSLDSTNKEINSELWRVVLLYESTIEGKRKLDSFDQLKGSREFSTSPTINEMEPLNEYVNQQVYDGGMSLPYKATDLATEDDLCRGSSAVPHSNVMTGDPMEVDTIVKEVHLPSSSVYENGSTSSSRIPNIVESMYRLLNRQSHDSYLKISHSTY